MDGAIKTMKTEANEPTLTAIKSHRTTTEHTRMAIAHMTRAGAASLISGMKEEEQQEEEDNLSLLLVLSGNED